MTFGTLGLFVTAGSLLIFCGLAIGVRDCRPALAVCLSGAACCVIGLINYIA